MNSQIKIYPRENGGIQRVQCVRFDCWNELDFLYMQKHESGEAGTIDNSVKCFGDIYENFLVPACPWLFGNMVMFRVPEDIMEEIEPDKLSMDGGRYGQLGDMLTTITVAMKNGVRIVGGKPKFRDAWVKELWEKLKKRGCVRIIRGKLPHTKMIPVGPLPGYLGETEPEAKLKVNASFFIMDSFDCATVYDQIGTVLGLCAKDGVVYNPPIYGREALLVGMDGSVSVRPLDIRELEIEIAGVRYKHGKNATIYTRPERAKTPSIDGVCLIIVGNKVVAVAEEGPVQIPASGFVLLVDKDSFVPPRKINCGGLTPCTYFDTPVEYVHAKPGDEVIYHGLEDVQFGIQVGNSLVQNGVKTDRFISRFYNIYKLEPVPYPPSLYPMNYEEARAARIALGADADGKPMLLWAEGAAKFGHQHGINSTGASLKELAEIAADCGMVNGVNLDGGGSAQILFEGKRALQISDRKKEDYSEAERLIPLGLIIR